MFADQGDQKVPTNGHNDHLSSVWWKESDLKDDHINQTPCTYSIASRMVLSISSLRIFRRSWSFSSSSFDQSRFQIWRNVSSFRLLDDFMFESILKPSSLVRITWATSTASTQILANDAEWLLLIVVEVEGCNGVMTLTPWILSMTSLRSEVTSSSSSSTASWPLVDF